MIKKKQAKELLELLHEDYQECKVTLVNSKFEYLILILKEVRDLDFKHHIEVLKGEILGSYNSKRKHAQIYLMNLQRRIDKEEPPSKYNIVYAADVLFHEVRHHFQNKYNRLKRKDIEKDCNRFSARMLEKHWDQLVEILNIK